MNKRIFRIASIAMFVASISLTSCGSGSDDSPKPNPEQNQDQNPNPNPEQPNTVAVTGVSLNMSSVIKNQEDGSETLVATITPANATNQNITWASEDSSIASVDANGKVTIHKGGSVKITATTQDGNHKATCIMHIIPEGMSVENNKTVVKMMNDKIPSDGHINIPSFITEIKEEAFMECTKLKTVNIPNSIKKIGNKAFRKSGLTAVHLPNSITEMGSDVFYKCQDLTTANFPNTLTKIPDGTFYETKLTEFTIPSSVTIIGVGALIETKLTSIVIPGTVKKLEGLVFAECKSLTSVTISEGVEIFEQLDFFKCTALTTVTIPSSVTRLNKTFDFCTSLTTVKVLAPTPPTGIIAFEGSVTEIKVPASSVAAYKTANYWSWYADKIVAL